MFIKIQCDICFPNVVQQSGAVEACWAHNPEVRRSKLRSANMFWTKHDIALGTVRPDAAYVEWIREESVREIINSLWCFDKCINILVLHIAQRLQIYLCCGELLQSENKTWGAGPLGWLDSGDSPFFQSINFHNLTAGFIQPRHANCGVCAGRFGGRKFESHYIHIRLQCACFD